jgi:predicted DCC family thiol-disulfide oxidoreductase YuxK
MTPRPDRYLVLYDADCGLCRVTLALLLRWDAEGILAPVALQDPAAELLLADIDHEQRMQSWHLITPEGERLAAGAALAEVLRLLPGGAALARPLRAWPGVAERLYYLVADHRGSIGPLIPATVSSRASATVERRRRSRATQSTRSASLNAHSQRDRGEAP